MLYNVSKRIITQMSCKNYKKNSASDLSGEIPFFIIILKKNFCHLVHHITETNGVIPSLMTNLLSQMWDLWSSVFNT